MATTVTVNKEFNGALAGEIFVQAFKKSDTISKGCITVLPNVIGTGYLPKISYSQALAEYSCGFTPAGSVTYTDKSVATKKYEIKDELCKNDFAATFQAQAAGLFAANSEIPATIQDAILLAMVNNAGALIDTEIWQGAGTTGHFNGLIAQFGADGTVIGLTGAAITSSNVQAELAKVYTAIPEEIVNETDLVMAVAPGVARAYKQSQIGNYMVGSPVGDKVLDYLGVRMESIAGLPSNVVVAYRVKNVAFLTGLEADLNEVRVIDLDAADGSGLLRTKMVFNAGVGYSFGSEIVYRS
jgi:hypothetical protein